MLAPKGFLLGVGRAGLKDKGNDILVISSERPLSCAAVFTTNDLKAAPVLFSQSVLSSYKKVFGLVANSGNANACTGERGYEDAQRMSEIVREHTGFSPHLVASTGVIGKPLDMEAVKRGIEEACRSLGSADLKDAAEAIMTTDTFPKFSCQNTPDYKVCAIAKGAGMINPYMATMLCFVMTDAAVEPQLFSKLLSRAVNATFNTITVDGDMSTNDSVIAFANGVSGYRVFSSNSKEFYLKLKEVLKDLAYKIVSDGEGATKVIRVSVFGAKNKGQAAAVARKVANSLLVKTAIFGADPNWGRIAAAAGAARAGIDEKRLAIYIGDYLLFNGEPAPFDRSEVSFYIKEAKEVHIKLFLGLGKSSFSVLTCDLSYDYVKINAEYTT